MNYNQLLFLVLCISQLTYTSEKTKITYDKRGYHQLHLAAQKRIAEKEFKRILREHPELINAPSERNTVEVDMQEKDRKAQRKSRVLCTNHQSTAGHLAAFHGEFAKLKHWIAAGGNLDQKDAHGKTVAMHVRDDEKEEFEKAVKDGKSILRQRELRTQEQMLNTSVLPEQKVTEKQEAAHERTALHQPSLSVSERLKRTQNNAAEMMEKHCYTSLARQYFRKFKALVAERKTNFNSHSFENLLARVREAHTRSTTDTVPVSRTAEPSESINPEAIVAHVLADQEAQSFTVTAVDDSAQACNTHTEADSILFPKPIGKVPLPRSRQLQPHFNPTAKEFRPASHPTDPPPYHYNPDEVKQTEPPPYSTKHFDAYEAEKEAQRLILTDLLYSTNDPIAQEAYITILRRLAPKQLSVSNDQPPSY